MSRLLRGPVPAEFPCSVIEVYDDDTGIVEVPDIFTRLIQTGVVEDDDGIEIPIYDHEVFEPDLSAYEEVTWAEVKTLILFDFKIGNTLYTFRNSPGATHAGIEDEVICIRDYPAFVYRTVDQGAAIEHIGHYRRLRHPTVPPLKLSGDTFYVGSLEDYDDTPFQDATDPSTSLTLADIELWKDGAYVKNYARPRPMEEV